MDNEVIMGSLLPFMEKLEFREFDVCFEETLWLFLCCHFSKHWKIIFGVIFIQQVVFEK